MNAKTVVVTVGLGLAVVGVFLPYAVKFMPSAVSIPLVIVGVLMVVVPVALWAIGRWRKPHEPAPTSPSAPPHRTGIDIEGGRGRFPNAKISGQDTSVRARDTDIDMDDSEIS